MFTSNTDFRVKIMAIDRINMSQVFSAMSVRLLISTNSNKKLQILCVCVYVKLTLNGVFENFPTPLNANFCKDRTPPPKKSPLKLLIFDCFCYYEKYICEKYLYAFFKSASSN